MPGRQSLRTAPSRATSGWAREQRGAIFNQLEESRDERSDGGLFRGFAQFPISCLDVVGRHLRRLADSRSPEDQHVRDADEELQQRLSRRGSAERSENGERRAAETRRLSETCERSEPAEQANARKNEQRRRSGRMDCHERVALTRRTHVEGARSDRRVPIGAFRAATGGTSRWTDRGGWRPSPTRRGAIVHGIGSAMRAFLL